MTSSNYKSFKKRLDSIISSLESVREDIEQEGNLRSESIQEDFQDEMQSAITAIQNCISYLENDETTNEFETENEEELNSNEEDHTQKLY